jgi:hypothetical protein
MTNTRNKYRLRATVVLFLLRKKSTEKSRTRGWNIQVACERKQRNTCQVHSWRQIAPGVGYVDVGRAEHGLR